ncbi:3-oxoadipate enol-lactone hydrolase [Terasakiispira papahanaumokuakeensis]|uniref:3-oxoadipate enol-lactone hydrolase n=2 Tax=Terasakiispira papahanaumokuakeensis TaxID=197479 RepID=A0A1E2VEF0_9GAMM|nr:3-oxoadipate enol-lactone hydrolase [Terasakiispira papahanaumokuakeensis]
MSMITLNDRLVAYRLLGDSHKPLMIMAHPLGMTQNIWDDLLPDLLAEFRVLTWDLPGHGASGAWPETVTTVSPQHLAEEALALARHAGAERFHFVGTSIGGVIGQQLLAASSEHLLSVTLTNTGAQIGTADAWNTRAAKVRELGLSAMAREIVPRWFGPVACRQQPALLKGWQHILGQGDAHSYALLCEMLGQTDFRATLGPCEPLPQLIGGRDDMATPAATLNELAQICGAPAPIIMQDVGHVPAVEAPSQLSALILAHAH